MARVIASLYEVVSNLGAGGGGVVYLGKHLRLNKSIVLKADKRSLSKTAITTLSREVDMLKNLSHTHIPQVYDFVTEDDTVFTVMDYIEGESLDKPLSRGEKFSSAVVVEWAKQALSALVYLHSRPPYGILHSDIKPANIMRTPDGGICLIDFNIALALGEDGAISVGYSHGYASPEHYGIDFSFGATTRVNQTTNKNFTLTPKKTSLTDNCDEETELLDDLEATELLGEAPAKTKAVTSNKNFISSRNSFSASTGGTQKKKIILDARADIYGIGATLYHLVSGVKPTRASEDVVIKPLTAEDCPIGLARIINRAMKPNKEERYQTAEEMLRDLNNIHKNDPRAVRFKKISVGVAMFLSAIIATGILTAFTGLTRMETEQTWLALAESSRYENLRGNRTAAINFALEAIPAETGLFVPRALPEAIHALTNALGVYNLSDNFQPFRTISLPSAPLMKEISTCGEFAAIAYAHEGIVVDLQSGEILFSVPLFESALSEIKFLNAQKILFAASDGIALYDLETRARLWTGEPATAIAVSSDGKKFAAVLRDENHATVYDENGTILRTIDFDGRKMKIPFHDLFANPNNNIFALSQGGDFLAVSFDDGSLSVFANDELQDELQWDLNAAHFEGGFFGDVLAVSFQSENFSQFFAFDVANEIILNEFEDRGRFGVIANENGIHISLGMLAVSFDPFSGEQRERAYGDAPLSVFAANDDFTIAAWNDVFAVYCGAAKLLSETSPGFDVHFLQIGEKFALVGGRDSNDVLVLRLENRDDAHLISFDREYVHSQARVSADGTRFMLFSTRGFRIYDQNENLISEKNIPDAQKIFNQQHIKESGNLVVIYPDALIIFCGRDGSIIFEEHELRSVFFALDGISILTQNGALKLIDANTGEEKKSASVNAQDFAAFAGEFIIDSELLGERDLVGAGETNEGYMFATNVRSSAGRTTICGSDGKPRFSVPIPAGFAEAFFLPDAVVVSPMHGSPAIYNLRGTLIRELDVTGYLTYIYPADEFFIAQFITADGEMFALLLDERFRTLATLPYFSDFNNGMMIFNYPQGKLRQSKIFSLRELLAIL